jgi:hypothetical protein
LLLGNALARYVKDANSLHWPMVCFLTYAAAMMLAAGTPDPVQRQLSLGIAAASGVRAGRFQVTRGPMLAEIHLWHAYSCY